MPTATRKQPVLCAPDARGRRRKQLCRPLTGGGSGGAGGGRGGQQGGGSGGQPGGGSQSGQTTRRRPRLRTCAETRAYLYFKLQEWGFENFFRLQGGDGSSIQGVNWERDFGVMVYFPGPGTFIHIVSNEFLTLAEAVQLVRGEIQYPQVYCPPPPNLGTHLLEAVAQCLPVRYGVPPIPEFAGQPDHWFLYGSYYLLHEYVLCPDDYQGSHVMRETCTGNTTQVQSCDLVTENFPYGGHWPGPGGKLMVESIGTVQVYLDLSSAGWPDNWDGEPLDQTLVDAVLGTATLWLKYLRQPWDYTWTGNAITGWFGNQPGSSLTIQTTPQYFVPVAPIAGAPGFWRDVPVVRLAYHNLVSCFPPTYDDSVWEQVGGTITFALGQMHFVP